VIAMEALFKKLNYKKQGEVLVLAAPSTFAQALVWLNEYAKLSTDVDKAKEVSFAICFVTTQHEIDALVPQLAPKLIEDAVVWLCYPKGTSKNYSCDFNRDTGWKILGRYQMEPVRMVAIDSDWSALRFRHANKIKTITRSEKFALTDEAKRRTTGKRKLT